MVEIQIVGSGSPVSGNCPSCNKPICNKISDYESYLKCDVWCHCNDIHFKSTNQDTYPTDVNCGASDVNSLTIDYSSGANAVQSDGIKVTYNQLLLDVLKMRRLLIGQLHCKQFVCVYLLDKYDQVVCHLTANMLGKVVITDPRDVDSKELVYLIDNNIELEDELVSINVSHEQLKVGSLTFLESVLVRMPLYVLTRWLKNEKQKHDLTAIAEGKEITNQNVLSTALSLKQIFGRHDFSSVASLYSLKTSTGYIFSLWIPILFGYELYLDNADLVLRDSKDYQVADVLIGPPESIGFLDGMDKLGSYKVVYSPGGSCSNGGIKTGLSDVEVAPLISLNTIDYRIKDVIGRTLKLQGTDKDTVGKPIPGMAVKIVNDNDEVIGPNEKGRVYVKGPAVYGNKMDWIETALTGMLNEQGFLII